MSKAQFPILWDLKKKIREKGLNLETLSELSGYDDAYISKVINGHVESKDAVAAIKKALK